MLKTIMLVFVLSLPGKPDVFQPQVFARSSVTSSCDNIEYIKPALYSWALQVAANHPRVQPSDLTPETVDYICYEMDHVDPDMQPDERGA